MKRIIYISIILLLVGIVTSIQASRNRDISRLEDALSKRGLYSYKKEKRIDSLKTLLQFTNYKNKLLSTYNSIYKEYYTYRFDSAMNYIKKMEELSSDQPNSYYNILSKIDKSVLLSTAGHFSESVDNLNSINRNKISKELLLDYYLAYEWAYRVWAEYSDDNIYSPIYQQKELKYQDSILSVLKPGTKDYYFWQGENLYRKGEYKKAEDAYYLSLKNTPVDTRLYARAMFGLALVNQKLGNKNLYEHYLINSAISDQVIPLKENLALQELAFFIFNNDNKDVAKANKYLDYSMEDAIFYNNRLRLLEISKKVPEIVYTYQDKYLSSNRKLTIYLIIISVMFVGILILILYIFRQMLLVNKQKAKLAEINEQLNSLNSKLVRTNEVREEYVSLFLGLCAAYIDKLNKYQNLVRRKIKSNQIDDLIKLANAARLSESDSKEFFVQFDTAFLHLYPDFIKEFNNLLNEGSQIELKKGEILNTELRIYALIRIGITDSTKIANLLFYSTQTIYNYRSTIRAKAKDKESFEKDVENLCKTI